MLQNETEAYDEEENYEQRSILGDSTTIASKDDEDSDQDELSIFFRHLFYFHLFVLLRIEFICKKKDYQDDNLNKPEFEGLWNKKVKNYDSEDLYKENLKYPAAFKSKAEKVFIRCK